MLSIDDFFILLETISKGKRLLIYRFKSWIYFQKSLFSDLYFFNFKIFETINQIILIMYIIFMLNFFPKYNHTHTHPCLLKINFDEASLFRMRIIFMNHDSTRPCFLQGKFVQVMYLSFELLQERRGCWERHPLLMFKTNSKCVSSFIFHSFCLTWFKWVESWIYITTYFVGFTYMYIFGFQQ